MTSVNRFFKRIDIERIFKRRFHQKPYLQEYMNGDTKRTQIHLNNYNNRFNTLAKEEEMVKQKLNTDIHGFLIGIGIGTIGLSLIGVYKITS